jgi:hypothetical protein
MAIIGKGKKISFKSGIFKRRRHRVSWFGPSLIIVLKVFTAVCVISGIVIGLMFLEKYVKQTAPVAEVDLELADVPLWASDQLKQKVRAAAIGKAGNGLGEDIALSVRRNLDQLTAWLDDVKVRSTYDRLRVEGRWRKPIGLVKSGRLKFYVDTERVFMVYVSLDELRLV